MITGLTKNLPSKYPLRLSTFSMVGTYLSCVYNVPARSLLDEDYGPLGAALIGTLGFLILVAIVYIQEKEEEEEFGEVVVVVKEISLYLRVVERIANRMQLRN
ncbi:hypothetical protein ACJRO7_020401 [Eucalyptus globulus]|uniref:Uncharacterized protein n=1 Tax=Eucalyptus globulus TaxID=34317 RepID=A0ABD3KGN1_EUCGL